MRPIKSQQMSIGPYRALLIGVMGRKPGCTDGSELAPALFDFVHCVHFTDYSKSKEWSQRRIDILQQPRYLKMLR